MPDVLSTWPRERTNVPFPAAAWNRFANWGNGHLVAPFRLIARDGTVGLIWNPITKLFTFGVPVRFDAVVTLDNEIWLDAFKADHTTRVHLLRASNAGIIEFSSNTEQLSILAALTNNTPLYGWDAATGARIALVKVTTGNVIESGEAARTHSLLGTTNIAAGLQLAANPGTANQVIHGGALPTWSAVATADLALGAATQSVTTVATTSSPTTTSASYGTLAEMGASFPAFTGGALQARFSGSFYNTAATPQNLTIGLSLDGAAEVAERGITLLASSQAACVSTDHLFTGVPAGVRNVTVRWKTAGGTATSWLLMRTLVLTEFKR